MARHGQLDAQTSGNGVAQFRDYDNRGQLTDTEVTGLTASLASFAYGFDAVGQLTSTETTLDGQDVDRAFEYHPLSQLSNVATTTGSATTWEDYDATSAGLLTEIVGGRELTYNTAQQLISADAIVGGLAVVHRRRAAVAAGRRRPLLRLRPVIDPDRHVRGAMDKFGRKATSCRKQLRLFDHIEP